MDLDLVTLYCSIDDFWNSFKVEWKKKLIVYNDNYLCLKKAWQSPYSFYKQKIKKRVMPGRKINAKQIGFYMKERKEGKRQITAAAKAGFSERSGRNIEQRGGEVARSDRNWKTRKDPFEAVWDQELKPLLEKSPSLQAKTLLEILQDRHQEKYPNTMLRTLQRRVKKWRALFGPEKEVIFRQNHPPGAQGLSDFTKGSPLGITIRGEPLEHIFYHYRLAYSGWEYVQVILGGESIPALLEGFQNALWQCGGAPKTHRTDSLSAAYKNISKKASEDQTDLYKQLCEHYQVEPTRNNKGIAHENGSIESAHRHLRERITQALLVRGERDFLSIEAYKEFIQKIVIKYNQRIHAKYTEEKAYLIDLPERKTTDYDEERVVVTGSSTMKVRGVIYSVPSRLIRTTLKVHIYDDRISCFVGSDPVITLERKRKRGDHVKQIDYRHLVGGLLKKPSAFMHYVYQEECFPTLAFKQTWETLKKSHPQEKACKEYLQILKEAVANEEKVDRYLEKKLLEGKTPVAREVQCLFKVVKEVPAIETRVDDLKSYTALIGGDL